MLVVNPTPFSIPLNTANVPTESVETQNRFAERIPESVPTFETSRNKDPEAEQQLSDADRTAKNVELREKILGSSEDDAEQSADKEEPKQQQAEATNRQSRRQELQDRKIIRNLVAIDRRVKAHEQAHASVGGVFAGAPSFTYQTGPNGVRYAVGGEVPIDISGVPGNPQATLRKAQQVGRAALAPADPSPTDRRIASTAQALASRARFEIARLASEKLKANQGNTEPKINGEAIQEFESLESNTSYTGGKLHAALATDATEQVGGQVSAAV